MPVPTESVSAQKRTMGSGQEIVPAKRSREEVVLAAQGPRRTSSLAAPIILLQGHEGEIYAAQFSPDGTLLASSGYDRQILLWNVYGECENFAMIRGHQGAILELQFSTDGAILFSCSTDKMLRLWDVETGKPIRKLRGHQSIVNGCNPARRGPQLICSGSDDGTVKVWDWRSKEAVSTFQNKYQVATVTFNDTSDEVISGGIDNDLKVWDMRNNGLQIHMRGHSDTVTGLESSPDGSFVLSNSMDNTLRVWDVRPFAPEQRCVKMFQGHSHNFEKNLLRCAWSPDGSRVSCGSADRFVYVWDAVSRRLIYKLPGHNSSVNQTDFHPVENIILSAGSDKKIYLGEIE